MKKVFLALLFAAALGWSFSVADYLTPNESTDDITYVDMVGPDGAYVMYYLNNEAIMLIHNGEIVKDNETVRAVLERYYFDKDFPKDEELGEIAAKVSAFNESRKNLYDDGTIRTYSPPEAYCLQITGLNFKECNDKESCLLACAAVPVCKYALEGIGDDDGFLNGMKELKSDTDGLTASVGTVVEISNEFSGLTYSNYDTDVKSRLNALIENMRNVKKYSEDIQDNFLFSDLLPSAGLQSFCAPVNYSDSDAEDLDSLADTYDARTQNLLNADSLADEVINKTLEREYLKVMMDTESEYGKKFGDVDEKYGDMYSKYVRVSKIINDTSLKTDVDVLKKKRDSARDDIYKGNYKKADLTLRQFNILADDFEETINNYFNKTSKIEKLQALADKKIIIAEWNIEIDNILLGQQLQAVRSKKNTLDERIANKINPDDIDGVIGEYQDIADEIDEVIQVKKEHALDIVLGKIVNAANRYSDTLANAYINLSGGTYAQRKQVRDFVFPATLVMVDLVSIAAFIAAFVYMVASGRIKLHKLAAVLWSFIFIAFFMTVAGGSIASYLLINEKTNKSSFETFYSDLLAFNSTAVIVDNREGAVNENCALDMKSTFENEMNKTVRYYSFDLDGCTLKSVSGNGDVSGEKVSIAACEEEMESMPRVFVKKSDADETSFSIKYAASATISGSDDYIGQCKLNIILGNSKES